MKKSKSFFILLLSIVSLTAAAKPAVRFRENFGTGGWGIYNPNRGIYFGPSLEFVYSPVFLNVNNTAFLMGDFVFRISGYDKDIDVGGAAFGTDLEFRFYNKKITRAKYGFSVSYGWNSAVGYIEDNPLVSVWGFDWVRAGLITCNKGSASKKQRLYYLEFQEWEGNFFVGMGVEIYAVDVRPQLHSRVRMFSNSIKLKKYR